MEGVCTGGGAGDAELEPPPPPPPHPLRHDTATIITKLRMKLRFIMTPLIQKMRHTHRKRRDISAESFDNFITKNCGEKVPGTIPSKPAPGMVIEIPMLLSGLPIRSPVKISPG
jgi:hypothetical protein